MLQQIKLQLGKLIPVHKVADFPRNKKTLLREMALLKIVSSKAQLKKAKKLCKKKIKARIRKGKKDVKNKVKNIRKKIRIRVRKGTDRKSVV